MPKMQFEFSAYETTTENEIPKFSFSDVSSLDTSLNRINLFVDSISDTMQNTTMNEENKNRCVQLFTETVNITTDLIKAVMDDRHINATEAIRIANTICSV